MKQDAKNTASRFESLTDQPEEALVPPLTADQAQALRGKLGSPLSPWRVWLIQSAVMVLCSLLAWLLTQQASMALSAFYGGLVVVLPHVLLIRGMTRGAQTVVASALSFLFWETLKVGSSVAMLILAPRAVPQLSWPVPGGVPQSELAGASFVAPPYQQNRTGEKGFWLVDIKMLGMFCVSKHGLSWDSAFQGSKHAVPMKSVPLKVLKQIHQRLKTIRFMEAAHSSTTAHAPTAGEYTIHHLQHLQNLLFVAGCAQSHFWPPRALTSSH
jgi:ATP synthase protein I